MTVSPEMISPEPVSPERQPPLSPQMHQYTDSLANAVQSDGGHVLRGPKGGVDVFRSASGTAMAWRPPHGLEPGSEVAHLAAKAIRAISDRDSRVKKIANDVRLSDAAKKADSEKIVDEVEAKVEGMMAEAKKVIDEFEKFRSSVFAVPALEPTNAVEAINDREVRDFFNTLSTEQRLTHFNEMQAGQHERVLLALMRSPLPLKGSIANSVQVIWDDYVRRTRPDAARSADFRAVHVDWLKTVLKQIPRKQPAVRRAA